MGYDEDECAYCYFLHGANECKEATKHVCSTCLEEFFQKNEKDENVWRAHKILSQTDFLTQNIAPCEDCKCYKFITFDLPICEECFKGK